MEDFRVQGRGQEDSLGEGENGFLGTLRLQGFLHKRLTESTGTPTTSFTLLSDCPPLPLRLTFLRLDGFLGPYKCPRLETSFDGGRSLRAPPARPTPVAFGPPGVSRSPDSVRPWAPQEVRRDGWVWVMATTTKDPPRDTTIAFRRGPAGAV